MKSTKRRAFVMLLATAILALLVSVTVGAAAVRHRMRAAPEVAERKAPELPREWRWKKEAIRFDDMFMGVH